MFQELFGRISKRKKSAENVTCILEKKCQCYNMDFIWNTQYFQIEVTDGNSMIL